MSRPLRFLGIQAGEGPIAAGLFSYSLALGVGRVFVLTASQALFLEYYPASDLAYVYMIAAVATIATSAAYLRLGRRLSPRSLILVNLGFTLAVTVVLRLAFAVSGGGWPAMALAAWFHVVFALTSFAFWSAATRVVDIRQGKRLFPVATTGDVVAFSLGGLLILRTVDRLGTENLLWIGAAGFAFGIAALLYTLARSPMPLSVADGGGPGTRDSASVRWSSPYLRLMMAYFVLSAVVFIFLDNAFNDVAQRRFEGAAQLARFFATYSAIAAIVNFFFRSLFAGRLVRRFGMIFGLAILPAAVGLGAAAVSLAGTLLPGLALVFWLTVATRLSDKVLRGVQQSSMATLYQPLGERGPAIQTTMDGIVDSAAIGLTGAALLGLNALFEITAVELAYLLVAFCLMWVLVAVALKRAFVTVLGGALQRRRLRGAAVDLVGQDVLALVRAQLASPYPEEVVYALELLSEAAHPELPGVLLDALGHEAEEVRREAARYLAALPGDRPEVPEARSRLGDLLRETSASDELRGAAARALAQLSEEIPAEIQMALASPAATVRRGAMVGLLRSGSIEGIVHAGAALLESLRSERAEARAAGAEVLRDAAMPAFYRQALRLLRDGDPQVRVRAVEAAAAMGHPGLWPAVVEQIRDPSLVPAASEACLKAGPVVIPYLLEGFDRDPADRAYRLATIKILGLLGGDEAGQALLPRIGLGDREERSAVLSALARGCPRPPVDSLPLLGAQLEAELADVTEDFATLADLEAVGDPMVETVRAAIENEIHAARHRLFLLLALLRPGQDLLTAWENYASGTRTRRAYALELLDSHLAAEERGRVFPALEDLGLDERLEALGRTRAVRRLGGRQRLEALAGDEGRSGWTRLTARRLGSALGAAVPPLEAGEEQLYERALRLGSVELFRELPGAVLARMVPKLQAVDVAAGEPVFHKGDPGDGMYVILSGRVRVHDEARELAVLEPDQVVGEFTVLQRSPRTASVSALESTRLLKLTQEDLHELIREQVGVARALIRVILRRLRRNRPVSRAAPATPE